MDHPNVVVRDQAPSNRRGLVAEQRISAGEEIAVFNGAISAWDSHLNVPNEAPDFVHDHSIQFHPFMCRDSKGIARYANHSCDPNCGIKGLFRIVAMRDIQTNEEITWDYAMAENDEWEMPCECGSPICRGIVRGFRFLPIELRRRYAGFLSEWHFDPYVFEAAGEIELNARNNLAGSETTLEH